MSSLSTTGSGRLNGTSRNRSASSNNVVGMNHARKTIRRAQAMGLITTMPFSLSSPSPTTPSDSIPSSTSSSVPTSRNGSLAEPGAGEPLVDDGAEGKIEVITDDESGTPKAGSVSRLASATPAIGYSPLSRQTIPRHQSDSFPRRREGPFEMPRSVSAGAGGYDGGMIASTGWLITVVPPDSLYYAYNPEPSTFPESENAAPQAVGIASTNIDGPSMDPLDDILSAARLNKWRKGKILPLAPDLRAMMKVIGREWNLPSEVGMELFLASGRPTPEGTCDMGTNGGNDGMNGMLNEETWRMIWGECVAEAEATRKGHAGEQTRSTRAHPPNEPEIDVGPSGTPDPQHILSPVEISPTLTEPPLTGNTFGMASEHSSRSLGEISAGQVVIEPTPASRQSSTDQREQSTSQPNQVVSSHAGTLTPASSQTSFGPSDTSTQNDLPVPAAQGLLSPSPSSVSAGASSSQQLSPFSARSPPSIAGWTPKRVLGRIEFDFDSSTGSRGEWYALWLKRKVQARQGWNPPGLTPSRGMKPLQLGARTTGALASEDSDDMDSVHEGAQMEYAPLMDEDEAVGQDDQDAVSPESGSRSLRDEDEETGPSDPEVERLVSNALATTFSDGPDDFVSAFTVGHNLETRNAEPQAQFTWKDIGSRRILDNRVAIEQLGISPSTDNTGLDDVTEVRRMLEQENATANSSELAVPARNQLLASPIDLASPNVDRDLQPPPISVSHPDVPSAETVTEDEPIVHGLGMGIQMDEGEKRGSALVISSQLDMLEKGEYLFDAADVRVLISSPSDARAFPSGAQVLRISGPFNTSNGL